MKITGEEDIALPIIPDSKIRSLAKSESLLVWSRLIQIIGVPLGLSIGAWLIATIDSLQQDVVKLQTQMEERTMDRYTATDARHDFAVVGVQVDDLSRRVGILENNFAGVAFHYKGK